VNIFVIHFPLPLALTHFCLIHRCVVFAFLIVRSMQETTQRITGFGLLTMLLESKLFCVTLIMKVICFKHDRWPVLF
jgi:hypothetical protein